MISKLIDKVGYFTSFACLILFPLAAYASHPKCDGPENWAASMAFTHLKNAGMLDNETVDFASTKVGRIASEKLSDGLFVQVHQVVFSKLDGSAVTVITKNKASNSECSEGPVTVYVVNKVLGGSR